MKVKSSVAVLLLLAAVLACNLPRATPTPTAPAEPPEPAVTQPQAPTEPPAEVPTELPTEVVAPVVQASKPVFAMYPKIQVRLPESYEGYDLPVDLSATGNLGDFLFSTGQADLLSEHGFVVAPAHWREFHELYENARYTETPVFVTTDSVYHVYHLLFDKMLRDLEREHFVADIRDLTGECLAAAQSLYAGLMGTDLEELSRRVVAYFAVANVLIDASASVPAEVADLVEAELAQIQAHAGLQSSPIFSADCPATCDPCDTNPPPECLDQSCMCEDYSQYVPRGHYTRSDDLQRYFRTMMWYGRINMRLQKPDETRMALLITYILRHATVRGHQASDLWARVYDPTVFIVGQADDLGFHEYGAIWDAVYGPEALASDIADDGKLAVFVSAARKLPPPQVNSMWVYIWEDKEQVTQGFRFMGQRFVLDAYIFEELTWREVGTTSDPRMTPKGLDVMAALGSDRAYALLDQMGETGFANYPDQMTKLRGEIAALQMDSWTQTLYWTWLYALEPLIQSKGGAYPSFMRSEAWANKDLQGALGSWTELKHDTILYAKQVMAEMGGGPPPEPPHGWVEPNPGAYARLLALTRMTREGLESRGLLTKNTAANLMRLDELLFFLLDVAQRELEGETLTFDDYERIKYYGGELEALTLAAADQDGEGSPFFEEDEWAAVVADVATDPTGQVQEEGTGYVNEIYVVVPDGEGGLHIAKGGVFSYYEFLWPMAGRLTDQAWQAMLEAGEAPSQPAWTRSFTSP